MTRYAGGGENDPARRAEGPRGGTAAPPQNDKCVNLEETIAVAVGIAVGIAFLAFFLIAGGATFFTS